jgi:hypothetical protein
MADCYLEFAGAKPAGYVTRATLRGMRTLRGVVRVVADYTVGSVIVLAHMVLATRYE